MTDYPEDADELAELLAERAIGTALDNANDMGIDPETHASEDWPGYADMEVEVFFDRTAVDPYEDGLDADPHPVADALSHEQLLQKVHGAVPEAAPEGVDPLPQDSVNPSTE